VVTGVEATAIARASVRIAAATIDDVISGGSVDDRSVDYDKSAAVRNKKGA
jgi:hypothetical protein